METTMIDRDLVITRTFNAPRELVYKLWTEPMHLAQWWGPKGFSNPVCRIDVRPSGEIYIDMQGPDGILYPMSGIFTEVSPNNKLAFVCTVLDEKGNCIFEVLNTVTFADNNGTTKLTMHAHVTKTTPEAEPYLTGMNDGWNQSLDRLSDCVAKKDVIDRIVINTRLFNAPREIVFDAWIKPDQIKQWWGPKGFTNTINQMDVKPGGEWDFVMHGPDGTDYHNKSIYEEIVRPERIVFNHVKPIHKFQVTATFEAFGNKTRVTFQMLHATVEECEKVKVFAVDANEENFDKLEAHLNNFLHQR